MTFFGEGESREMEEEFEFGNWRVCGMFDEGYTYNSPLNNWIKHNLTLNLPTNQLTIR